MIALATLPQTGLGSASSLFKVFPVANLFVQNALYEDGSSNPTLSAMIDLMRRLTMRLQQDRRPGFAGGRRPGNQTPRYRPVCL